MSTTLVQSLLAFGGIAIVVVIIFFVFVRKSVHEAKQKAENIIKNAETDAKSKQKEAELGAKETAFKLKSDFEKEAEEKRKELQSTERRLQNREDTMEKRFDVLEKKEDDLKRQEQSILDKKQHVDGMDKKYQDLVKQMRDNLEKIAGISSDEAKRKLCEEMIGEAKQDSAREIKRIEDETKEESTKRAGMVISTAVQRMSGEFVSERSISVVPLPSEEMKGRIIGREGRNIKALEAATGIDFVIDDTPEAVTLSGFNPIRREIARLTLEGLISDGRIHPGRIEEMVTKFTKEVDKTIKVAAEEVCMDLNIQNVHPELMKLIGSLKYRYSYGQNILQHSVDVAHLCGMMAAELKTDEHKAKRAGLLHDIGKAVSHEVEGSHALVGMEYARKFREDQDIVHAIGAHHEDFPIESILDSLVAAADALSGARPGARREVLEAYVKRVEDLERISASFKGVEKAYAIQAGREMRVLVKPEEISDAEASVLAREVSQKIEKEMTYPGQIKVTVIRETRASDLAK